MIDIYIQQNGELLEKFTLQKLDGISMSFNRWPDSTIRSIGFANNSITVFLEDKPVD
jgi:hypothetical protein